MADQLEELYQKYNRLSSAADVTQLSDEYLGCIEHIGGSDKEKKLVAQIIVQYFKDFPQHEKKGLNYMFDLCENEDPSIRMSVITLLPTLCKHAVKHVSSIIDVLIQLLQMLEQKELNVTCNSLNQIFKVYPEKTFTTFFSYIEKYKEKPSARENLVKYVYKKLIAVDEKITATYTDLLIEEGKKILLVSTVTEFLTIISFLTNTKLTQTITGQRELVDGIAQRAKIQEEFVLDDKESCHRLIICTEHALPLFSTAVESTDFVKFYCEEVLGKWDAIAELPDGETAVQPQLLQQLASLSTHCGKLNNPSSYIVHIYDKLKRYMPLPPEDGNIDDMPNLDFTSVECLLYAFHRLARQSPDFLTADPAVLKEFRSRLNYFSRGVAGCLRSLDKMNSDEKSSDKKLQMAPVVLGNISSLIKDLFNQSPVYKCNVQLSFKTAKSNPKKVSEEPSTVHKRHTPIQFSSNGSSNNKQIRPNKGGESMQLYSPPGGKFSNKLNSYDRPGGSARGRGAWRGRRGWRGGRSEWNN